MYFGFWDFLNRKILLHPKSHPNVFVLAEVNIHFQFLDQFRSFDQFTDSIFSMNLLSGFIMCVSRVVRRIVLYENSSCNIFGALYGSLSAIHLTFDFQETGDLTSRWVYSPQGNGRNNSTFQGKFKQNSVCVKWILKPLSWKKQKIRLAMFFPRSEFPCKFFTLANKTQKIK